MNKPDYPCVPMEEDEKYNFDDCQNDFVRQKVAFIKFITMFITNILYQADDRPRVWGALDVSIYQ